MPKWNDYQTLNNYTVEVSFSQEMILRYRVQAENEEQAQEIIEDTNPEWHAGIEINRDTITSYYHDCEDQGAEATVENVILESKVDELQNALDEVAKLHHQIQKATAKLQLIKDSQAIEEVNNG